MARLKQSLSLCWRYFCSNEKDAVCGANVMKRKAGQLRQEEARGMGCEIVRGNREMGGSATEY